MNCAVLFGGGKHARERFVPQTESSGMQPVGNKKLKGNSIDRVEGGGDGGMKLKEGTQSNSSGVLS
jgi:hypothetical protein